jgi:hypothetical protein
LLGIGCVIQELLWGSYKCSVETFSLINELNNLGGM